MRYVLLATDRETRHTMYWSDTAEWRHNRGFAERMPLKRAKLAQAELTAKDATVIDIAIVPE